MNALSEVCGDSAELTVTVTFVGLTSIAASGADLARIDRTIVKEPAYQAKSPVYCLLAFGPEAKPRVWLVLDVLRNGNGDLTETDERIERDIEAAKKFTREAGEFRKPNVFNLGQIAGERFRLEVHVHDDNYVPPPDEHEARKKSREERRMNGWETATLLRGSGDFMGGHHTLVFCPIAKDEGLN